MISLSNPLIIYINKMFVCREAEELIFTMQKSVNANKEKPFSFVIKIHLAKE